MKPPPSITTRQVLLRALAQAAPIVFGYIPVGFAYGVLARKMGLSELNTVLMSLIVFAGSSQLIAVSLFAAGTGPLNIILTTFVVNLRHLLMSAALSPYLKTWKKIELSAFAFELTDETFAVHTARFAKGGAADKRETLYINLTAQASWVLGTVLGMVASTLITDVKPVGLDYALPAMFIALLMAQIKDMTHVIVALAAALASIGLLKAGAEQWNVIVATIIAATLGVFLENSVFKKKAEDAVKE